MNNKTIKKNELRQRKKKKDLQMRRYRLSWITWVGPTSKDKWPYRRKMADLKQKRG
jgi:hypothetical protein